ncbi:MAG: hypothetical protein ABI360_04460 [Allobranchiibius sp.]
MLFGIADSGAFLLGTALNYEMSELAASIVSGTALLALGVYLVVVAVTAQRVANTRWVWALPFALTLDNISFGLLDNSSSVASSAALQLASSTLLALGGVVVSVAIVRAIPKVHENKILTAGIAGVASIIAVPVLLFVA